jgi:hypothetical protein
MSNPNRPGGLMTIVEAAVAVMSTPEEVEKMFLDGRLEFLNYKGERLVTLRSVMDEYARRTA